MTAYPESQRVFVVDGARTPFLKARGQPGLVTPVDLAVWAGRPLLLRQPCPPDAVRERLAEVAERHGPRFRPSEARDRVSAAAPDDAGR